MSGKTIYLGADHAGFDLKQTLISHLRDHGYEIVDVGPHSGDQSVDYPDFAGEVAQQVSAGNDRLGLLVCGTGIGMSIAANKVSGIRAAVVHDEFTARVACEHNNANVLALGARLVAPHAAIRMVDAWLNSDFETRHQRRLDKIHSLEPQQG